MEILLNNLLLLYAFLLYIFKNEYSFKIILYNTIRRILLDIYKTIRRKTYKLIDVKKYH